MINIHQDTQFILEYAFFHQREHFEIPNSIFILKALLRRQGILPSKIAIFPLREIAEKREIQKLLLKINKKNTIFLISICERGKVELEEICSEISIIRKYLNKSLIIIGGPTVAAAPEIFMRDKAANIIVLGEAEIFIPHFFKALEEKKLESIPNAYILKNKNYIYGGREKPLSPFGIYKSQKVIIEARKEESEYQKQHNYISLELSRGCCFTCAFCYNQLVRKNLHLRSNNWLRSVSPSEAAKLIEMAVTRGFKKICIANDTLTSNSNCWLKEFLECIKTRFLLNPSLFKKKVILQFSCAPIDFQRDYMKKFIKKMTHFFKLFLNIGIEALDKETLLKFNKPHKNNPYRIIDKISKILKPYVEKGIIEVYPNLIPIHPWTTFRKLKGLAKFWYQWRYGMDIYILFLSQHRLWILSEKIKIVDILKKEKLFVKVDDKYDFKFAYAKKVIFPRNKNDTDINRFVSFLDNLGTNRLVIETQDKFYDLMRGKKGFDEKTKKEIDSINKKLYQFYVKTLDEAKEKWPELTYKEYKRESYTKIGEFLEIVNKASNSFKT